MDEEHVRAETFAWIDRVVIGLDLCPFAAEPVRAGRVRCVVSAAREPEAVADALEQELRHLGRTAADELETTLLVTPDAFADFPAFNQFLAVSHWLLERLGVVGEIQIASFHPRYCFEGAPADDAANATNRSPHPMLHLLREESVARAVAAHPDPTGIPGRNAARLRALAKQPGDAATPRDRPPASARARSSE